MFSFGNGDENFFIHRKLKTIIALKSTTCKLNTVK